MSKGQEGEFKKQYYRWKGRFLHDKGTMEDFFFKIVEDAKKGYHFGTPIIIFPKIENEELRKFIEDALKLLESTFQEKDKWFLEWFGSVEKEVQKP